MWQRAWTSKQCSDVANGTASIVFHNMYVTKISPFWYQTNDCIQRADVANGVRQATIDTVFTTCIILIDRCTGYYIGGKGNRTRSTTGNIIIESGYGSMNSFVVMCTLIDRAQLGNYQLQRVYVYQACITWIHVFNILCYQFRNNFYTKCRLVSLSLSNNRILN